MSNSFVGIMASPAHYLTAPVNSGGKGRSPVKSILAGGIAGGIEICITYPTEYVKTQLQLEEKAIAPRFNGPINCASVTVKEHGFFGLYRGLPSLLIGSIPKSAIRFLGFEQFKKLLVNKEGTLSSRNTFLAGLGAGIVEAIVVVCPMETIKVKFIHDQSQALPRYKGFLHGVATIVRQEGLGGVYRGLFPTILKQGSNQGIRFFTFHEVRKFMQGGDKKEPLGVVQSLMAGGIAGAASVIGNNPIDVVKSRMQGLGASKYKSSWDCAKQVIRTDGFIGFYKGSTPRLARVCADVAIVMTLYEQIMKLLDKTF